MGLVQSSARFLNYHLNPFPVIGELIRIFPGGLVWGMGFYSLVTLSYAFGVFFMSLVESLGIYFILRNINAYMGFFSEPTLPSYEKCKTGFTSVTLESLSTFGDDKSIAFPSPPIYILSVAIAYILSVMLTFKNNLEALGTEYASRLYISSMGLSALLFLITAYRAYNSCDTLFTILISIVVGLVIGGALVQQNNLILGMDGINLLGIPLLAGVGKDGQQLYVCNQPSA